MEVAERESSRCSRCMCLSLGVFFLQGFHKKSMKEIHFADIFCTSLTVFFNECLLIQHQTGRNEWQEKQTGNTDNLLCEELSWMVVWGLSKC